MSTGFDINKDQHRFVPSLLSSWTIEKRTGWWNSMATSPSTWRACGPCWTSSPLNVGRIVGRTAMPGAKNYGEHISEISEMCSP